MNKKLVTIFAATMIALSITGVAFGLWYKILYIHGSVDTGDLDARFILGTEPVTFWYYNASQAFLECPTYKTDMIEVRTYHYEDDQELFVDIWDLYPCIWVKIPLVIENDGTVPWVVNEIDTDLSAFPGHVLVPDLVGTQVDPGQTTGGFLWVHITNDAAENSVYTFSAKIICVQWNEYPFEPPYPPMA